MLRIRLIGAPKPQWSDPRIVFDPAITLTGCDGVLAWGAPTEEFLFYQGPRGWYNDEARSHSMYRTKLFKDALQMLAENEIFHHSNPNPAYRFPCATHYGEMTIANPAERRNAAVAVVSNFGGRIWWLRRDVALRNRFILQPQVALYGNPDAWSSFRRWPWSRPGPPENLHGPFAGVWHGQDQIAGLARYQVAVCLENTSMPYYFTEKFINAARAGCIPVYRAHPTVRDSYLAGASWIDPARFNFDPAVTLAAAFKADADAVRGQNYRWLHSDTVKATNGYRIWSRLADLFVERCKERA